MDQELMIMPTRFARRLSAARRAVIIALAVVSIAKNLFAQTNPQADRTRSHANISVWVPNVTL
jgi:hypothetical protein